MLDRLEDAIRTLPPLLADAGKWDSLFINRRKPHTYRVFTTLPDGLRLCLHKFEACEEREAFFHPDPWPGAFVILKGRYRMKVGLSQDRTSQPQEVATLLMREGSSYEIVNPMTWHSVIPLTTTYTVMVNGEPWSPDITHRDVKTTKGKNLERMPPDELKAHLDIFQNLVDSYVGDNFLFHNSGSR